MTVGCPHNHALDNKRQPYVAIQKHGPVDEGFNVLPRGKRFTGLKKQTLAADIQALAEDDPIQHDLRSNPPAFYRQTQ